MSGRAKKKRGKSQRHVPERTCVACHATRPKRELIRVVRLTEGGVIVDETGKRNGRGAYLCRRRTCWQQALRRGSLERALRVRLTPQEVTAIQRYADSLPEEETRPLQDHAV